jgi:hypothetical protein
MYFEVDTFDRPHVPSLPRRAAGLKGLGDVS